MSSAEDEFVRRFPTATEYLAYHQAAGHICCGCVQQDPPLACCNPGHGLAVDAGSTQNVTISKEEYDDLVRNQRWLQSLQAAGVDNWVGYEFAHEIHREQYGEADD